MKRGPGRHGAAHFHSARLRATRNRALLANRPRAYEDFAAVAQDLIKRGVTSAKHLGAEGGSNGGLLMGNMLTVYPQLFGPIACEVSLLDMNRYSHRLMSITVWRTEGEERPIGPRLIDDTSYRSVCQQPGAIGSKRAVGNRMHPIRVEQRWGCRTIRDAELVADCPFVADVIGQPGVGFIQVRLCLCDPVRFLAIRWAKCLPHDLLHWPGNIGIEYIGKHARIECGVGVTRDHCRRGTNAVEIFDDRIRLRNRTVAVDKSGKLACRR